MNKISFSVDDFPNLLEEFRLSKHDDWISFLHGLGYTFSWNHYASKKKKVEMNEADFMWFKLRWA